MRVLPALAAVATLLMTACPSDGDVVGNQAPGAFTIAIGPAAPVTTDPLIATILSGSVDPDGDAVTYTYLWLADGLPQDDLASDTVPADRTAKGQTWDVSVTPTDGTATGTAVTAQVVIGNLPPTGTASLVSTAPRSDEAPRVEAEGTDPDGDEVEFTYAWTRDGDPVAPDGPAVDPGDTTRGEVWAVTVTPRDDVEAGAPILLEATIGNGLPSVGSVSLDPDPPTVADDVRCEGTDFGDPDGDNVASTFRWFLDDAEVAGVVSRTLAAGEFDVGDRLACEITPTDGREDGEAVRSSDGVVVDCPLWHEDADEDGYGDPATATTTCDPEVGWVEDDQDCDDTNPAAFPGAPEVCTALDLNCDTVFSSAPCYASCKDINDGGASTGDGVYSIDTDGAGAAAPFDVYCDMTVDGGGWTMIQRTVWDNTASAALLTDYASFYSTRVGTPAPGNVFRLEGALWPGLDVLHESMSRVEVRKDASGLSCDPLFYTVSGETLSVSPTAASVSTGNNYVYRGTAFQATDTAGNACVADYDATPWFYASCCWICPSYAGSLFGVPRPAQSASNLSLDFFGNEDEGVCNNDAPVLSNAQSYLGANAIEFYVR